MDNALCLLLAVALPGLTFAVFAIVWIFGWEPAEKMVTRCTSAVFVTAILCLLGTRGESVTLHPSTWFEAGGYSFPLWLRQDHISFPLLLMTLMLGGLIGKFSATYLHRDRGFFRFYVLLHLFAFGASIVFASGSLDMLVAGWELVGITSVLLIGFFHYRAEPVSSAMRVFAYYRACDIGLLAAVALGHHAPAWGIGLLLLLAAAGKSAQAPFSGWLPRAMEGPTPSSAIFYGAISVHIGAYLLLRTREIWSSSEICIVAVAGTGVLSAISGTLSGRAASDAKTSLANAALAQVGIIFVEIAFGFERLAVWHILGHSAVRTLQFLRAPSALHDYHRIHAAAGGHLGATGKQWEQLLPESVQLWLYRFALDRGHWETLWEHLLITPLLRLSRLLQRLDEAGGGHGEPAKALEARRAQDV